MITFRDFRYTDYKLIQDHIPEWKARRLNYDIDHLNIEKMLKCLLFFNNNKLAMLSGIDDLQEFIPNTYRILTKAITTKNRPKCWGPYLEERFFSNVMAGISINSCESLNSDISIVVTTNLNSRIDQLVRKSKTKWLIPRNVVQIYGVDQSVWDIDLEECKIMTNEWIDKLAVQIEGSS